MLTSLKASGMAIPRTWSLISFRFLHRCIWLGWTGHPYVLVVHWKMHRTIEGRIRRPEGASEWEPIKFFPRDKLRLCPKFITKDSHTSLPRSRSHNRPTNPRNKPKDSPTSLPRSRSHNRPTNPRNKPQTISKRKRNTRSKGLSDSAKVQADGPRPSSG
jgi:hypothetical protein